MNLVDLFAMVVFSIGGSENEHVRFSVVKQAWTGGR